MGAAAGVLASYVVGSLILLAFLSGPRAPLRLIWTRLWPQAEHVRAILAIGGFNALTVVQLQMTSFIVTAMVATLGTAALAGYGAAVRLELLQLPILFGLGSAMIAMIATNIGGGARARAQRIAWSGIALCTVIGLAFAVVALCRPEAWLRLFSADPAVIAVGAAYLRSVGPTYPALGFGLGLLFAGLGLGQALRPLLAGSLRLAFVTLAGWAALELWAGEAAANGLPGLFLAIAAGSVVFALAMLAGVSPALRQGGHGRR
jgi:Na+-driven multidrug efflux pump